MNKIKQLYIKYFIKGAFIGAFDANRYQLFEQRAERLRFQTLHSSESGVTGYNLCDTEVIVTLTSYGRRIFDVYLAIESIMQGSIKPNRLILWLEDGMKDKILPITLQRQMKRGLEVKYTNDIKSYKKLVPSLKLYPEATLITIDDDVIYNFDLVENLINSHKETPDCIIASRVHRIKNNKKNGTLAPYNEWYFGNGTHKADKFNFATGVGGILYPPPLA